MGHSEEKFISTVDAEKKCSLCRSVLDNPVSSPCGRVYCSGCVLPSIVQNGRCPSSECTSCQSLTPGDLKNMLDLKHTIISMQVKCDFQDRGCSEIVSLVDLPKHSLECQLRPLRCKNRGCQEMVDKKDVGQHETDQCDYRPVGICQKGCGLVILHKEKDHHNCSNALKGQLAIQDLTIETMEIEAKKLSAKYSKREKAMLAQISTLHSEIQLQAMRFQKKLSEYRSQISFLAKKAAQVKVNIWIGVNILIMICDHFNEIMVKAILL